MCQEYFEYYIRYRRIEILATSSQYPDYKGFFCAGYGLKKSWPNLAIDAIGLIPEVEGGASLVRKIGNFKGYRGIVADQYGKRVIKAVNEGFADAHAAEHGANIGRGIGEKDWAGLGLTLAGFFIPP